MTETGRNELTAEKLFKVDFKPAEMSVLFDGCLTLGKLFGKLFAFIVELSELSGDAFESAEARKPVDAR